MNGRCDCLTRKRWTSRNELRRSASVGSNGVTTEHVTHSTRRFNGGRSSTLTSSPALAISSRIDIRTVAHRSVRRRHASRLIYRKEGDCKDGLGY